jgi:hypothetical protein
MEPAHSRPVVIDCAQPLPSLNGRQKFACISAGVTASKTHHGDGHNGASGKSEYVEHRRNGCKTEHVVQRSPRNPNRAAADEFSAGTARGFLESNDIVWTQHDPVLAATLSARLALKSKASTPAGEERNGILRLLRVHHIRHVVSLS